MSIDATTPGSPGWWLRRLGMRLEHDRARFDRLEAYARGNHPLPLGNEKMRTTYRRFQRMARANFTGLVAESVRERLQVTGFSTGGGGDAGADAQAWATWQANHMDADSGLVHQAAVEMSRAYVMVGADTAGGTARALITGEDPRQVVHESDPQTRRRVRAALKLWADDVDGGRRAVLYLPDGVVYFTGPKDGRFAESGAAGWELDTAEGDDGVADPVLPGLVPVVPFVNRPSLSGDLPGGGLGEFEDVIDIQDRINITLLDRMIISAMQAYRQRWAIGVTIDPKDPPFEPGADLLWHVPAADARFGDFQEADLRQVLDAAKEDIRQLAAITRTPPHYLVGELNNVNGETLKATETGLVAKCSARKLHFGESWEQVNRLAALVEGRQVAEDAEVIWADSESRSVAELADAAVKKQAAGVPWRQLMVDLGYSPQEIERMEAERAADALIAGLALPPTPPAEQQPAVA